MKLVTAGVLASAMACSVVLVAQSGPRRDGNWEVTTTTSMNGMPPGPPRKNTQCVTKEQASDPSMAAPGPPQGRGPAPQDCKVTDQKVTGNTVSWTSKCTGAMSLEMIGEIVYSGDTYAGTVTTNMNMNGQAMSIKSNFTGKRLGDCVK
jgi:hypothetical protein